MAKSLRKYCLGDYYFIISYYAEYKISIYSAQDANLNLSMYLFNNFEFKTFSKSHAKIKERNENKLKNQYLYRAITKMTEKEEKYRR